MKPEDMKSWRGKLTQETAGLFIGRSARQMREYEAGRQTIDKAVELACAAVADGIYGYDKDNGVKRIKNHLTEK